MVCDSTACGGFGFLIRGSVRRSSRWIDRGLACVVRVWSVGRLVQLCPTGVYAFAHARSVCDDRRSVAKYKSITYYMRARSLR